MQAEPGGTGAGMFWGGAILVLTQIVLVVVAIVWYRRSVAQGEGEEKEGTG